MNVIKKEDLSIDELVEQIKAGKTIVYPTETTYGLGCDATNQDAVDKIFAIKKRQKDKPLLCVMPDVEMAMEYIEWSPILDTIAQKYWPGPVTVVAPVQAGTSLAGGVVAPDGTLAFRVTNHPLAYELCSSMCKPFVSTSANIAASDSPYDIKSVEKEFKDQDAQPDIVIDGGELQPKSPSTIVRIVGENIEVLRQGEVVVEI